MTHTLFPDLQTDLTSAESLVSNSSMLFSSPVFIFAFLPVFFALYFLLYRKTGLRWTHLLIFLASSFFYFWGEQWLISVMFLTCLIDFACAIYIDRAHQKSQNRKARFLVTFSIVSNLLILGTFKYFDFFRENINFLLRTLGLESHLLSTAFSLALPLGISFYTFQSMSYTIDVYRQKVAAKRNLIDYLCFVTMFPQLIAGPIVRYVDVQKELLSRSVNFEQFASGLRRFLWGLAKKMLIANNSAILADQIFALPPAELSTSLAWIGALAYTIQIYFDFSGYSDMAIALAQMIGFKFPENFNYPYVARSVQDFWRRWHMSLSGWFRDYLYIPLGGNRVSEARTRINLMIVFLLCGLWHGASWNFVVWGLFHGTFLSLERTRFGDWLKTWPRIFQHSYTLLAVVVGWVFFRAPDLTSALQFIHRLFWWNPGRLFEAGQFMNLFFVFIFASAALFSMPVYHRMKSYFQNDSPGFLHAENLALIALSVLSVAGLMTDSYNPFIYFRF